jgi:hypothetical protein
MPPALCALGIFQMGSHGVSLTLNPPVYSPVIAGMTGPCYFWVWTQINWGLGAPDQTFEENFLRQNLTDLGNTCQVPWNMPM